MPKANEACPEEDWAVVYARGKSGTMFGVKKKMYIYMRGIYNLEANALPGADDLKRGGPVERSTWYPVLMGILKTPAIYASVFSNET